MRANFSYLMLNTVESFYGNIDSYQIKNGLLAETSPCTKRK